jgi:hypothetical protein
MFFFAKRGWQMSRVETIKHVEGVRARWMSAHADPTINPAWANAERDIGLLLQDYDALAAELAAAEKLYADLLTKSVGGIAADRIKALEAALLRAADSFHDLHWAFKLLKRETAAEACRIAEEGSRATLTATETHPYTLRFPNGD